MASQPPFQYLNQSRRVREVFARHELSNLLGWAFGVVAEAPDDELESFRYGLAGRIRTIEPAWAPLAETLSDLPLATLRAELRKAFTAIRGIAHDIAAGRPTALIPMRVRLYAPHPSSDREGRPRWSLDGRPSDALVWGAMRLFSEVPRSLIRSCGIPGCSLIYVAGKNQRYCPAHQIEAYRRTQRRAERAFRARAKAKTKTKKRRT